MCNQRGQEIKRARKGRPVFHEYCHKAYRSRPTIKLVNIVDVDMKKEKKDHPRTIKRNRRKLRTGAQSR